MKNWRSILIKRGMKEIPITIKLLQSNGLEKGDYVSPKVDLSNSEEDKVFLGGKTYKIVIITKSPLGITLESELGDWFFPFPEAGVYFITNFVKVILDEEDQLSQLFDVIPFEILTLLSEHGQSSRAVIRKELIAQGFPSKTIQDALMHLEKHGFILAGDKLGTVVISPKGTELLEGKK
jgi:hypothetical protein